MATVNIIMAKVKLTVIRNICKSIGIRNNALPNAKLWSLAAMQKVRFILWLIIFIHTGACAQSLNGYYNIDKIISGRPTGKESFYFFSDSNFRYQSHSIGLVLIGEGRYKIRGDSLHLYFNKCDKCIREPQDTTPHDIPMANWVYIKKIMPWGLALWGITNETMSWKILKLKSNELTLSNKNAVIIHKRRRGIDANFSKKHYRKYFYD